MALPFTSDASVHNACTAALVALHHGATLEDIQHKLPLLTEPTGRLSSIKRPRGGILIQDDCNHDLGSLEVALRALDQAPDAGQRVAIVGDVPQSGLTIEARIARMVSLLTAVRLDALVVLGAGLERRRAARCGCSHANPRCGGTWPA